jgi:hypothetical protein
MRESIRTHRFEVMWLTLLAWFPVKNTGDEKSYILPWITGDCAGRKGPAKDGESRSPPYGVLSCILTFDATNVPLDGSFE